MNTTVFTSLHSLDAADLSTAMLHDNGHVSICIGDAAIQLHWESFETFETWLDRLHSMLTHATFGVAVAS